MLAKFSALKYFTGLLPENIMAALNTKFPCGILPDIGCVLQQFTLLHVMHFISHNNKDPIVFFMTQVFEPHIAH